MQDTLEGKAAPADAPPPLQDHQQHAAAFGPLLSAQLRPGPPSAIPASAPAPSAAASALGSPCNLGRQSGSSWEQGQQQPAAGSLQQLADKAAVEAARLQLSQDAERAVLQQQVRGRGLCCRVCRAVLPLRAQSMPLLLPCTRATSHPHAAGGRARRGGRPEGCTWQAASGGGPAAARRG
jgi:hypothetical protein